MISVDFLPKVGGISTMVHHLANALVRRGIDVGVLAPNGARVPPDFVAEYRLFVDEDARPKVSQGHESLAEDQRIYALLQSTRVAFPFGYVLLMHPFYYGPGAAAYARTQGVPLGAVFYGFELRSVLMWPRTARGWVRMLLDGGKSLGSRTRKLIRDADQLFALSGYTARLVRQGGAKHPVTVIGCGIARQDWEREVALNPAFDRVAKQERRRQLGLPDGRMVVFVGRLVASKNVGLIFKGIAELTETQAVIVGSGPLGDQLKQLARELGIEKRVTWIGDANEARKWEILRAADILCLPSRELSNGAVEGFGIVLLEATASATPVIAARSGGMTDVVAHGKTGLLCDPESADDLRTQISRLLSDDTLAGACVESARHQIRDRFNWEAVAARIVDAAF